MLDRAERDTRPAVRSGNRLVHLVERMDEVLAQFAGSADIGPYVAPDPDRPSIDLTCPACGTPISAHDMDRTAPTARLYCPEPRPR